MMIVHVLPALTKGGGERVAVDLANWSAANGHEVTVVAGQKADEGLLRSDLLPSIEVRYVVSRASRAARYAALLPWIARNWSWLRTQDIVHCHMTYGAAFGTAVHLLKRLAGRSRPLVVETYHAVGMPIPRANRWLHARMASRRDALALMAEDPFWCRFRQRRAGQLVEIIPNGVSLDRREISPDERLAYRRSIGIPDSAELVVGTIGQLRAERRPWLYPQIFKVIAAETPADVHFVIAGAGPERSRVERAISAAGLVGRVHLPGLLTETAPALSIMDLYLTVNIGSITGLAALEAAASGLPILAMQFDETYRSLPDDWIWSGTDLDEIGRRSAALLNDPAERSSLARRQQAYVTQNRTVDAMAKAYLDLYNSAAERAPRTVVALGEGQG